MRAARIIILGIAVLAGGGALYIARQAPEAPTVVQSVVEKPADTVGVLVAANDINVGTALAPADIRWQKWPVDAVNDVYISDKASPGAVAEWTGAIARAPFVAGEPIRAQKLIKANGSGFLSAILPAGMRAVATSIAVDTAAGGFILPNDHVDVILTRQNDAQAAGNGAPSWTSETILRNVRVLAIDQTIQDQNGQKVITGQTATLELQPQQAEMLALAKQLGRIYLTLRALADSNPNGLAGSGPETGAPIFDRPRETDGNTLTLRRGIDKEVLSCSPSCDSADNSNTGSATDNDGDPKVTSVSGTASVSTATSGKPAPITPVVPASLSIAR